jgi:hypothetical protein
VFGEDNQRRADELQTIVQGLCHCSLRTTRASAVPGQLEAARFLAQRVRLYQSGETAPHAEYWNEKYLLRDSLQHKLQGLSFYT